MSNRKPFDRVPPRYARGAIRAYLNGELRKNIAVDFHVDESFPIITLRNRGYGVTPRPGFYVPKQKRDWLIVFV